MTQPFLPVATQAPHTKTLAGFRRPPQLEEVPFPLLTRAQKETIRTIRAQRPSRTVVQDPVGAFASLIGVKL